MIRLYFILFILFLSCKKSSKLEVVIEELSKSISKDSLFNDLPLKGINCEFKNEILTELFNSDQDIRNTGTGNIDEIDNDNLQTFISLCELCGFPKNEDLKNDKAESAVFLILQHAPKEWMLYYYTNYKELVNDGIVSKSTLAYMQDKILLHHDYPQIYGTQIVNGRLYKLIDPNHVNERRTKMKMGNIEKYLDRYGLNYMKEIEHLRIN